MARYGYTEVACYEKNVWLCSTDSQVVNWFVAEVKTFDRRCNISEVRKFSSDEPYYARAHGSWSEAGYEIRAWVVRHLGQNGWEPFASEAMSVCLRLRYD